MQHILCSAAHVVDEALSGEGFIQTNEPIFELKHLWIGPRPQLEEDEQFKQIIPYVLLSHQNKIAVYQRTKKGGESRLHNQYSIGFGGHIDAFDLAYENEAINLQQTIANSAQREIDEELLVSEIISKSRLGYIVDNSNPVGRVHVGVVERWELATDQLESNEDEIKVSGWFDLTGLKQMSGQMENWSQHIAAGLQL